MSSLHANCNVLVVDSSRIVAERIEGLLAELENISRVYKAANSEQALEMLAGKEIDIVLLDTQLPGNKGFGLLTKIQELYPEIKTIILTNQTGNFYRTKAADMGVDHFIDKSGEFESIVPIINDYAYNLQRIKNYEELGSPPK